MEVPFPASCNLKRSAFFDVKVPLRKWDHDTIVFEFSRYDFPYIAFDPFYPEYFVTIEQQLKIQ